MALTAYVKTRMIPRATAPLMSIGGRAALVLRLRLSLRLGVRVRVYLQKLKKLHSEADVVIVSRRLC